MTRTIDQMIASEVLCCMSSLVSTLAKSGINFIPSYEHGPDIVDLAEQAAELAAPVDDWEEAAIQAGWTQGGYAAGNKGESWEGWYRLDDAEGNLAEDGMIHTLTAQSACEVDNLEPYQREIFEHWAVTDWFADKLETAGEKVDRDFAGLCVWARTTTGQSIAADSVIQRIYAETHTELEG